MRLASRIIRWMRSPAAPADDVPVLAGAGDDLATLRSAVVRWPPPVLVLSAWDEPEPAASTFAPSSDSLVDLEAPESAFGPESAWAFGVDTEWAAAATAATAGAAPVAVAATSTARRASEPEPESADPVATGVAVEVEVEVVDEDDGMSEDTRAVGAAVSTAFRRSPDALPMPAPRTSTDTLGCTSAIHVLRSTTPVAGRPSERWARTTPPRVWGP